MSIAITCLKPMESSADAFFPYLITCIMKKTPLVLMLNSRENVNTVKFLSNDIWGGGRDDRQCNFLN